MTTLKQFRSFDLAQRENGDSLEIERTDRRVVCLTFDTRRLCFAELVALLGENGLDEEGIREFTERAQIATSIASHRWAELFDSGIDDGVYFYAREFVDGERLGDYAKRQEGAVSNRIALDIVLQLGEAVEGLGDYEYLIEEVDLNDARIFCSRQGGLELKMAGFPLEPAPMTLGLLGNAPAARLRKMFEQLRPPAMQSLLGEMDGLEELDDFMRRVRAIRTRYPETCMEGDEQPQRVIESEIYQRWRPREFLSQEFKVIEDVENRFSPYSEALMGPNGRQLRLQVLPPVRMLRDEFLTFYKTGIHPTAVAVHAEWKNEDFRLIAEEKLSGASLATILGRNESLNPAESLLLIRRIDEAIASLEEANVIVPDFQPENIFLCPAKDSGNSIEDLIPRRPFTIWPEFSVRIRTHLTMSGLVHPPDASTARQTGNDVVAYLAFRGQGLREKARQLLEDVAAEAACYEETVTATDDEENDLSIFTDPLVGTAADEEAELLPPPIAVDLGQDDEEAIDDEIAEEWEDDEEPEWTADSGEPEYVGLGYEADYGNDAESEFAEEDDELAPPVLSPIAAAMGVREDDAFYEQQSADVVEYPMMEWQSRRHGFLFWVIVVALGVAITAFLMSYFRGL